MFSDLAVTALVGACVLLVIAAVMIWAAGRIAGGSLPLGGALAIPTRAARRSPEALTANQAAAPYLQHYGVVVACLAGLTILLTFVSDIAAAVVHLLAVVLLVLGAWVCVRKARGAEPMLMGRQDSPSRDRAQAPQE